MFSVPDSGGLNSPQSTHNAVVCLSLQGVNNASNKRFTCNTQGQCPLEPHTHVNQNCLPKLAKAPLIENLQVYTVKFLSAFNTDSL